MSSLDTVNFSAGAFLQWLLLASASATLIAGIVLIVQKLFSRWTTPAGRQRLWWLVVARLLLPVLPASAISIANIPVAKLWVTEHRAPTLASVTVHREPSKYVTTIRMGPIPASSAPAIQLMPTVQLASEPGHADLTWVLIWSIWLVISLALLARLIWANHAMAKRLRSGSEIDDPSILNLVRECASAAGLRRAPCIVETTAVGTPAVHGVWKPRILVPVGLMQSLPASQRRHVILHELSHIRHHDVLANWLLAILAIFHWFNPLLWLAMSRLKADRELARDAWVIRIGSRSDDEASTYADTLIDLAQRLSLRRSSRFELAAPIPGLFGRSTSLRRRLLMIQHLSTRRGSNLIGFVLLLLIAGGFLTRARAQTVPQSQKTVEPPIAAAASQPVNEKDRQRDVADLTRQIQTEINHADYKEALADTVRLLVLDPKNEYAAGIRPLLEDKVNAPQPAASKDLRWDIGELTRQLSNAVGRGDDAAALVWADRLLQRDPGNAYAKEEHRVLASRVPALDMQRALARVLPQVHFDQVGFEDVVEFLRDVSGLNIFVNWKVLEAAGIDRNTPVTANVHNVKFSKALDLILDSVGGGKTKVRYSIEQNIVTISTKDDLDKYVVIQVYDVRDLLASESDGPTRQQMMDSVQKLILQNVDSETWKENNGHVGSLRIFDPGGQLIVTQTPENHRQIVALLDRIREERDKQILLETEIYDCDSAELAKQMETWAPTTQPASKGIVVSAEQVEPHLVELKRNRQVSSLPSPRVTLFNGQQASVTTSIQKKYATDYTRVRLPNGIVRYDPIEQTIDPGVQIDLQATLTADRKSVVLSIHPKVTTLVAMAEERWKGTKDYQLYVEKPQLSVAETKALVSVPEGKILLMTVAQPDRKHTLLVVVKPTIVQLAAMEQKPVPVEQLVRPEDKSVDLSSHYPWMDKHQPTSAPDVVPDNVRRINGSR